ncbi:4a-hydroxytetrahydrobiopterin dehydratase [Nitrosomonas mobilis]|uniref:Putative pterin-4-alpha-carbinolamine dehydratase n=1 Tax=Nitrosomonas mobilis TaxID=51642 RepID=A0A1G5SAD6_9PROT|nr:4a-hydroxytetrahydrobiopterin dehydratase [Nitrosomonas mobilis]SCZ84165.1 putative pterin-4-alpha-carbinolamine dehydratase [Nitrosomonas mobilis]
MTDICNLSERRCQPCEGGVPPLNTTTANDLLVQLDGWKIIDNKISKTFSFKNFYQTMAFVNAVAWIANREDHHPDMMVSYHSCQVIYSTHAINGLSENDFICAAKIDALLII